tara:strand:+ start:77 stop:817 length:741 start_codon:yes stop_codon:yes gene_type:complete
MANFTGRNICSTYESILNLGALNDLNTCFTASGLQQITDGRGCKSSLCLGAAGNGACIDGPTNVNGSITTCGTLKAASICQCSSSGTTVLKGDLSVGSGSTACLTVDSSLGDTFNKGKLNVGCNCTTSTLTLKNQGCFINCGIIYGCNDIVAFSSSDSKLKNDLNKIESSKDILKGLNGYTFKWNEKSNHEGEDLGVIAQEVKKVLPQIVHKRDDGYLAVDYIKLIPVLIEEVKRLSKEVDELKKA